MERTLTAHQRIRYEKVLKGLFDWAISGSRDEGPTETIRQAISDIDYAVYRALVLERSEQDQEDAQRALQLFRSLILNVEYRVLDMRSIYRPQEVLERIDLVGVIARWWLGDARAKELRDQAVDVVLTRPG